MNYELPESFYNESRRRSLNLKRMRIWSVIMIVFTVLNLFSPYGLIRRNRLSAEFPNSEFGVQRAYVNEERELVLERLGYVDRTGKYVYGSDGKLAKYAEYDLYTGVRLDSTPSISSQYRTSGVAIDIKPGTLTQEKIRLSSQKIRRENRPTKTTQTGVPLNESGLADIRSLKELPEDGIAIENLQIRFMSQMDPPPHELLPGHQYLPFRDAHCYVDPLLDGKYTENVLYITTDQQRYIHRILLDPDQAADNWVRRDLTVYIPLELERGVDSYLCHDPDEPKLMLVNADGRITWFDDQTLQVLDSYVLKGNWEREFASLFQSTSFYSDEFGLPLNRLQAFRIYRGLAVMLLAGLVLLVLGYLPGSDGEGSEQPADDDNEDAEPGSPVRESQLRL